jgi:uncharacterized protein (DUF2237 family)
MIFVVFENLRKTIKKKQNKEILCLYLQVRCRESSYINLFQVMQNLNVFGEALKTCSNKPLTGYFRDGCCNTDSTDYGSHTVCAIVTDDFLEFSAQMGNDLTTPMPQYEFEGLKAGDRWCLCASRWLEAYRAGKAPFVDLEATNEQSLKLIPMEILLEYALKENKKGSV